MGCRRRRNAVLWHDRHRFFLLVAGSRDRHW
jgi:hypothetical protein